MKKNESQLQISPLFMFVQNAEKGVFVLSKMSDLQFMVSSFELNKNNTDESAREVELTKRGKIWYTENRIMRTGDEPFTNKERMEYHYGS